ncbi:MAG: murein hydrolase activator EnvC family protein [Saccharofermentanales bacterium]
MNHKYKSRIVFTTVLLLFSLCLAIWKPVSLIPVKSVEAASINSLMEQQDKIEKQLAALKKEKEALKNKSAELKGTLSWLNSRTAAERLAYKKLVDDLNDAYTEMNNALAEAKAAEDDVIKKQAQYKKRLQVMFENRNKGTLEMLLEAKDLNGFMANIKFISIIADSDQKVLEELISAKDDAFLKRKAAEEYCAEIQIYVDKKNKEIETLKKNLTKTQTEIASKTKELLLKEKAEKELLEESNAIAAAIKKLQSSAKYYGGTMVWPTPGYTGINPANGFGMRLHPIYKYWRMHNGVDINAPFDAKIVAVADGKVIIAKTIPGYNKLKGNNYGGTNYGNYIIIDHGGGISTVYGHCKLLKVSVGDPVKAGQLIAITGSTGLSTGAHLHFEVRESGNPVNPLQKNYLGVKGG